MTAVLIRLTTAAGVPRRGKQQLVETVLPEAPEQGFIALLDQVFASGERYIGAEAPPTWSPEPGAPPRGGYFDLVYQPLFGADAILEQLLEAVICDGTRAAESPSSTTRRAGSTSPTCLEWSRRTSYGFHQMMMDALHSFF